MADSIAAWHSTSPKPDAKFYDETPELLPRIDSMLAGIAAGRLDPVESGRESRQSLPWGGHPTGMYMARTIERVFGKDSLLGIHDPFTFVLRYDDAAARIDSYRFSNETLEYLERLRAESVN